MAESSTERCCCVATDAMQVANQLATQLEIQRNLTILLLNWKRTCPCVRCRWDCEGY
jgi:hypothetical protein